MIRDSEQTFQHLHFSPYRNYDFTQAHCENGDPRNCGPVNAHLNFTNADLTDENDDGGESTRGVEFSQHVSSHISTTNETKMGKTSEAPTNPTFFSPSTGTSKDVFTTKETPELSALETDASSATNFCMATSLFVSYLIEAIVQVILIVQCYHFFKQPLNWVTTDETGQAVTLSTSFSWFWILVISSLLSSFLVTLISSMWVFRGMDFSGRLCGRLLCYVMHSLLLGLFWRYLKLAFAYERADLEEFLKLKSIQIYIQSLPLVTIHFAWILTTQEHLYFITHPVDSLHTMSHWLIVIEVLSFLVSILLLSASPLSSPSPVQGVKNNLHSVVIVSESSSALPTSEKLNENMSRSSDKLNSVVSTKTRDKDPNLHFNDSGTASGVDNGQAAPEKAAQDIVDSKPCSVIFLSPVLNLVRVVSVQMMSHHSHTCEPGRALLLVTRVISLGMLFWKMNYWTGFITLLHFTVSFAWVCWCAKLSNRRRSKLDNLKFASSPSSQSTRNRLASEPNDTSCDSRSDSSSNDSGLVVKSEVLTKNGMHAVANGSLDYFVVEVSAEGDLNEDNSAESQSEKVSHANIIERDGHTAKLNQPGDLSSCFNVLVHRRNKNEINREKLQRTNSQAKSESSFESTQILSLAYVLFWDLSNSPSASHLSQDGARALSNGATIVPVLLVLIENVSILIYHHLINPFNQPSLNNLPMFTLACLLSGWVLIAGYQLRGRVKSEHQQRSSGSFDAELIDNLQLDDDTDSGYGKNGENSCIGRRSSCSSSTSGHVRASSAKISETPECLSMCCSSVSHPLNVKRKGCQDSLQDSPQFRTGFNGNLADVTHHQHNTVIGRTVSPAKFNECQDQELGRLMAIQCVQKTTENAQANSRSNSMSSKKLTKKPTILPSCKNPTSRFAAHQDNNAVSAINHIKPESVFRHRDDVHITMTCATSPCNGDQPQTANYSFVKEALTKKLSNKSSTDGCSTKKSHHHQIHPKGNESVKGDVRVDTYEEGEPQIAISSFKLPSPHHQQQHHPTTNNSNKCMPISIKSPATWLPETCHIELNDSSNRRNTSNLGAPELGARHCPEKYRDLDNNNIKDTLEKEVLKWHTKQQQIKAEQQHQTHYRQHCQNLENKETPDLSVFFEHKAGAETGRSSKLKQSRTLLGSNALRACRSANATPVAGSKHFPFSSEERETRELQQKQNHPYFQPSPEQICYTYSNYGKADDEVDAIERVTKEDGASRRIRNQITGKTYLSDGASLSSLDGLCRIRASTPVEIKKASRVIVNYPPPHHQVSDSKTVSRCLCKVDRTTGPVLEGGPNGKLCGVSHLFDIETSNHADRKLMEKVSSRNNNIYEKLIDDSYGILIYEGENTPNSNSGDAKNHSQAVVQIASQDRGDLNDYENCHIFGLTAIRKTNTTGGVLGTKLRILCAKCLQNHDPLLSNCVDPVKTLQEHVPEIIGQYDHLAGPDALRLMMSLQMRRSSDPLNPVSVCPYPYLAAASESTDYPSDTELTANNNPVEDDVQSLSTHLSSVLFHPQRPNYRQYCQPQYPQNQKPTKLSQFIWAAATMMPKSSEEYSCQNISHNNQFDPSKEFTGLEYVRTWLLASHPQVLGNEARETSPEISIQSDKKKYFQQDNQPQNDTMLNAQDTSTPTPSKSNHTCSKNKHSHGKAVSQKRRSRQVEKRQRPVGCGTSPPPEEIINDNNNVDVFNSMHGTCVNASTTLSKTTAKISHNDGTGDATVSERFRPPPSRKQHPLLVYDMMPRQEQEKPLTVTTHKKCRDQLDLFHKELETVV